MTRHLRAVAVAASVSAAIAACSASAEPSGTEAPTASGQAATQAASPHRTATPGPSPPPTASPIPAALQLSECEHTTGTYRVAMPEGWWVNPEFEDPELGSISACRFFAPENFDVMSTDRDSPVPEGVAIWMEFLDQGCVGYINPILSAQETTIDGYAARIAELAEGKFETNPPYTYEYVVNLRPDVQCEDGGEYILAFTRRDFVGDYEENKATLDRMMESVRIGEP